MSERGLPPVGLKWVVVPVALLALGAAVGHFQAYRRRVGPFVAATASLAEPERKVLEQAPALAVANAIWALGSVEAVRGMARIELDRLPESEGHQRARVFVRFGIIDTNPDGQAALFHQACVADERDCEHLREAAEHEVSERFVSPGNRLPPYFIVGHPHVPGP